MVILTPPHPPPPPPIVKAGKKSPPYASPIFLDIFIDNTYYFVVYTRMTCPPRKRAVEAGPSSHDEGPASTARFTGGQVIRMYHLKDEDNNYNIVENMM